MPRYRRFGDKPIYSPEQTQRYKSRQLRYDKAIKLTPDAVVEAEGKTLYRFLSDRSDLGYWEVSLAASLATYINSPSPRLQMCAQVIDLIGESDAEQVIWEQFLGPEVELVGSDTLFAQFDRSGLQGPFGFTLRAVGHPELFCDVFVYTTPTSFFDGVSCTSLVEELPTKAVPCTFRRGALLPQSRQGGFSVGGSQAGTLITWDLPTSDLDSLVSMVWQQNTTGQYLDLQSFSPTQHRVFLVQPLIHYRIETRYRIHGKAGVKDSCRLYLPLADMAQVLHGDDNFSGASTLSVGSVPKRVLPILLVLSDICLGSSVCSLGQSRRHGWVVVIPLDTSSGTSVLALATFIRQQLSGVIIG